MRLRRISAAAGFAIASVLPAVGLAMPAYAAQNVLVRCEVPADEVITTQGCDLGVSKQVSVNGGTFADANNSTTAPGAHLGDTITWQITLSNASSDPTAIPIGIVTVHDILPGAVTLGSSTASGGVFSADDWVVSLSSVALPATLTITTTANTTGLVQNTAALNDYDPCIDGCLGGTGTYADANAANDSDDAWVDVQLKPVIPQVLDASTTATLVNTGSNSTPSLIVAGALVGAASFLGFATRRREQH